MEEIDVKLPFHNRKQAAVLGHMLLNEKFFEQSRHHIRPDWFNDARNGKIYRVAQQFREVYHHAPKIDEVQFHPEIMADEPQVVASLHAALSTARLETANFGLDALRKELTEWLHAKLYRDGVTESQSAYNDGQFDVAYQMINKRMKEINTIRFDEEQEVSFDNPGDYLSSSEKRYEGGLTTGIKLLDDALSPDGESKGGGLFKGDTTIVLAAVNQGKTASLITVSMANIWKHRKVLFMSHEGSKDDLREKMLCSLLNVTKPELFAMYKTDRGLSAIMAGTEIIKRYFTYIPYNKAGMCVEDVIPIVRRRQELALAHGAGYELLVVDYPAKLNTKLASHGNLQKRNIDEYVYEQYVQLALELDIHSLLAIQANRQASKDNRDASRLLTMEDVAESWGPMMAATNVLSINRDLAAQVSNRVTFYVAKSRSSRVGVAIACKSDYARCRTHSEQMGGVSYLGTDPMTDKIDAYIEKHKGKMIPEHLFRTTG